MKKLLLAVILTGYVFGEDYCYYIKNMDPETDIYCKLKGPLLDGYEKDPAKIAYQTPCSSSSYNYRGLASYGCYFYRYNKGWSSVMNSQETPIIKDYINKDGCTALNQNCYCNNSGFYYRGYCVESRNGGTNCYCPFHPYEPVRDMDGCKEINQDCTNENGWQGKCSGPWFLGLYCR